MCVICSLNNQMPNVLKKAKNVDEKAENSTRAKYGIMSRFFGVKIQSKFENRKKTRTLSQSHWPDVHIFGIKPFSIIISISYWFLCSDNQLKINTIYDFDSIIKNLEFSSEID